MGGLLQVVNGAPDHCYYAASGESQFSAHSSFAPMVMNDDAYYFLSRFNTLVQDMETYENDVTNGAIADSDFVFTALEDSTSITESLCNGYWATY